MADLPMAQIPNFQLPGPSVPYQGGMSTGLATGFPQGIASEESIQQMRLQGQAIQAQAMLRQQEMHKNEVNSALDFIGKVGEQLKYLRPGSQKQAIANAMNALDKVAPEFGIGQRDPNNISDESIPLVVQYGKLRAAHLNGDISDATFAQEGGNLMSEMSQYERDMLKDQQNVIGEPNYEPGAMGAQPGAPSAAFNTKTGQVLNPQGAAGNFVPSAAALAYQGENMRGAAGATAPDLNTNLSLNNAMAALGKNNQMNDRIAMLEFGKAMNGGQMPNNDQLKSLLTAGPLGDKAAQYIDNAFGTAGLTADQRASMMDAIDTYHKGLQAHMNVRSSQYGQGAPDLPQPRIIRTLKNGKQAYSPNGKDWYYVNGESKSH